MWYLAELLFAEPRQADRSVYQCESCNVVLSADNAAGAYEKALGWAQRYAAEPRSIMQLLGVAHLTTIGPELADGMEICGRFFDAPNVWDRQADLVPSRDSLKAIVWEKARNTPVGELLRPGDVATLKRVIGSRPNDNV